MLCIRSFSRLALAACALSPLAASQVALGSTVHDGNGGPLLAGVVYTATSITVPTGQTLTVEPGAVLKLSGRVDVRGTLDAQGTVGDPILISSLADDGAGGDTNNDGSASVPAPGDWQGIAFFTGSAGSTLSHMDVAYHGSSGYSGFFFASADSAVSVANCVLRDGSNHGIDFNSSLTTPTIVDCELRDNAGYAIFDAHIASLPGLTDCSAQGNGLGDAIRVSNANLAGDVAIVPSNTLGGVLELVSDINIGPGETLAVGPGVTFKVTGAQRVSVFGTLSALGTAAQPVRFTSIADDSLGGDTNNDGAATQPAPGDWEGIVLFTGSGASVLEHVEIAYHGGNGYSGLFFSSGDSDIQVSNALIRDGANHGVDYNSNLTGATISFSELRDNAGHAAFDARIDSLQGLIGCTAQGNGLGDVPLVANGTLSGDVVLGAANTIGGVIRMNADVSIGAGRALAIGPGVTLKFNSGTRVSSFGTLEALGLPGSPVVLTSLADDANGGDTNKDGGASQAAPGDWEGVVLFNGSGDSVLEHVDIAYHGQSGYSGLFFGGGDTAASIADCVLRDGSNHGVDFNGNLTAATLSRCDLRDNAGHAAFDAHVNTLPGMLDCTAVGNGLGDAVRVINASLAGDVALAAANTIGGVITMAADVSVGAGETLTVGPGVAFKFDGAQRASVFGTLDVQGTAEAPVVFTSLLDDAIGGDTNADGAASTAAPGDWEGIQFNALSASSELRHLLTRFSGRSGFAGVTNPSASTVLDRVRVEHCSSRGFLLSAASSADGLVAYECLDGIVLQNGSFDLRRSTAANCSARGLVASANHVGQVASSLSFGSPINWDGFGAGQTVVFSGGTGVPNGTANFNGNPLFVDAANGDLRLSPGSACIDAGALGDFTTGQDIGGFPRRADGDLDGSVRLDMGAHEASSLELTVTGVPLLGNQLDFVLDGVPGFGTTWMVLGFGFQEYGTPVGSMFTDFLLPYILLGWPAAPSVVPVPLPPNLPVPLELVVQAAARNLGGNNAVVSTSNPVRLRVE